MPHDHSTEHPGLGCGTVHRPKGSASTIITRPLCKNERRDYPSCVARNCCRSNPLPLGPAFNHTTTCRCFEQKVPHRLRFPLDNIFPSALLCALRFGGTRFYFLRHGPTPSAATKPCSPSASGFHETSWNAPVPQPAYPPVLRLAFRWQMAYHLGTAACLVGIFWMSRPFVGFSNHWAPDPRQAPRLKRCSARRDADWM